MEPDLKCGDYCGRSYREPANDAIEVMGARLVPVRCNFVLPDDAEPYDAVDQEEDAA